jgi:hypothetical protein
LPNVPEGLESDHPIKGEPDGAARGDVLSPLKIHFPHVPGGTPRLADRFLHTATGEPPNEDTFSDQLGGRPCVCDCSIRPVAELYSDPAKPDADNHFAGAAEVI